MATRTTSLAFAMAALLAIPSAAMAQRWGRAPFPRDGACFFQGPEFRGDYFCVRSGDTVGRVPDELNNQISSIRVFGPSEVVVFDGDGFRGGRTRFEHNIRDLRDTNWNNRISSLRVEYAGDVRGPGGPPPPPPDRFDRDDRDRGRFDDRSGGRRDDRRGVDADAMVRRAYQDLLGREPDQDGLRQYRSRVIDDNWSEQQVRDSIRSSPEYRDRTTMTVPKAQEVVRRAYLNVLKREPDPGSQGYVDRVFRDHWSQEQVEAELRKSPEFRQKNAR